MRIHQHCLIAGAMLGVSIGFTASTSAAIVEYKFDVVVAGTPPTSPSTGTDTTSVEIRNAATIGADGSGVSGLPGDRAFVNATTGLASHAADNDSIDALTSFTVSGWLKSNTTSALSSGRIMENSSGPLILFTAAGDFQLQVDGNTAAFVANSGNFYSATQTWMFFAVTYDGTQTADNVKFYRGFRNASEAPGGNFEVALVNTATINQGVVASNGSTLAILNRSAGDRTLDATLDNFRIDGAANASGALTLAQLETYRGTDVPEPAGLAVAMLAMAGLLVRRRRA